MAIDIISRFKNAWNIFFNNKDPTGSDAWTSGGGYSYRPDRARFSRGNERSIVNSVYNRIAIDVASVNIRHVRLDENGRYLNTIKDELNSCLELEANKDQTGRAFIQDIVMSMFDEGCVAVVPVDADIDPMNTNSYKIYTMRVGQILEWYPDAVRVRLYDDRTGHKKDVVVPKVRTAIIENPLFAVINEPNSTMQRLIRKLNLLDAIDEQSGSGKLDLIVQLPYSVKSDLRREQADKRLKSIEKQLTNSKYGIAYIDSTEHVTQLNRAVENNLMTQIEYLTSMLYSQLGITQSVLDGTADEKTMLNYNNRTLEPILSAIVLEFKRKFLTITARSQFQSIEFFKDPFKLVPVSEIAEIADKFTRNEIMSSNEIRALVGMTKSDDPNADTLRNKNLNMASDETLAEEEEYPDEDEEPAPDSEGVQDYSTENIGDAEDDGADEADEGLDIDDLDEETLAEYEEALRQLDELESQIDELEKYLDEDEKKSLKHYASPYYDPVKAHEYYMEHRELKGRRSTSGLNDEGKNAARYVREQLNTEKKGKIAASKARMKSGIEALRNKKVSDISASRESTKAKIDAYRDKKISDIANHKTKTDTKISSLKAAKDKTIQKSKDKTNSSIEKLKSQCKSVMESHTSAMKSKIESLQSRIKGASDSQKTAIRSEIANLRAENKAKRAELQASLKESSASLRSEHKTKSAEARDTYSKSSTTLRGKHKEKKEHLNSLFKQKSTSLRSAHKETSDKARDTYNKGAASLREAHKAESSRLKDEYDKRYETELEKIKGTAEFQKQKKSKKK